MNRGALHDTRVTAWVEDGRNFVAFNEARSYDVIISEPSNPWMTGVANLFTDEFFAELRRRLRPDGVLAQWFHFYNMRLDDIRSLVATLERHFPRLYVFAFHHQTDLTGARLTNADLTSLVVLKHCSLQDADLRGARLRRALLDGARLDGADLSGADLRDANLWWAHLTGARLAAGDLQRASLRYARMEGAVLTRADLRRANLENARLVNADLSGAGRDA